MNFSYQHWYVVCHRRRCRCRKVFTVSFLEPLTQFQPNIIQSILVEMALLIESVLK